VSLVDLREAALELALGNVGVTEVGGNNRGPEVEKWLGVIGLPPGQPWCLAFVQAMYEEAELMTGFASPLPKTGKVIRFWSRCPDVWKSQTPRPGSIFCRISKLDDPDSPGHCGFVVGGGADGSITTVEGNTDEAGSRDGDGVAKKIRPPGYVNLGYIDIGMGDRIPVVAGTGRPSLHG
jgi:hypothetical protein